MPPMRFSRFLSTPIVLFTLLIYCHGNVHATARFQYGSSSPFVESENAFVSDQVFWVRSVPETLSSANTSQHMKWTINSENGDCVIQETRNEEAYIKCKASGKKTVSVSSNDGNTQELNIEVVPKQTNCYEWKQCIRALHEPPSSPCKLELEQGEQYTVTLWLSPRYNWLNVSDVNTENIIGLPDEEAKAITLDYYRSGEIPIIFPGDVGNSNPFDFPSPCPKSQWQRITRLKSEFLDVPLHDLQEYMVCPGFDTMSNVWTYNMTTRYHSHLTLKPYSFSVLVIPVPVTLFHCTTKLSRLWIPVRKWPIDSAKSIPISGNVTALDFVQDACSGFLYMAPNERGAILLQGKHHFVARETNFTRNALTVSPKGNGIRAVTSIRAGMVGLDVSGYSLYLQPYNTKLIEREASKAPWTHLASASSCDKLATPSKVSLNDIVIVWGNSSRGTRDFTIVSVNPLDHSSTSFQDVRLPESEKTVVAIVPLMAAETIAVLWHDVLEIQNEVVSLKLWFYDTIRKAWTAGGEIPGVDTNQSMGMRGSRIVATDSLFIWSSQGLKRALLHSAQVDNLFLAWKDPSDGVTVKRVTIGDSGLFAVLSNDNRIVVGREDLTSTVEIATPFARDQTLLDLIITPSAKLYGTFLNVQNQRTTLGIVEIPYVNYVLGVIIENGLTCPYASWASNLTSHGSYELDMGESVTIIFDEVESRERSQFHTADKSLLRIAESHSMSISVSDRNKLDIFPEFTKIIDIGHNMIKRRGKITIAVTRTVSLAQDQDTLSKKSGRALIRVAPTSTSVSCMDNAFQVSDAHVGCPSGRHLRIARQEKIPSAEVPNKCASEVDDWVAGLADSSEATETEINKRTRDCVCETFRNSVFSLPMDHVDFRKQSLLGNDHINMTIAENGPVTIPYDYGRFGCPQIVPYTRQYKPTVQVWDGDVFVKEVDSDFVVIDLIGRPDVSPSQTLSSVGCVRSVPTWTDRLARANSRIDEGSETVEPLDLAWLPQNHVDCFSVQATSISEKQYDGNVTSDMSSKYPVFNSTGNNFLTFLPTSKTTPFFFRVTVVDPEYSFCSLTAEFSIQVYAMPMDALMSIAIVVSVSLFMLGFLVVTYFWNKEEILKTQRFRNDQ